MSIYKLSVLNRSFGKAFKRGQQSWSCIETLGSISSSNRNFSSTRVCQDLPGKFNEANVISDALPMPGQNSFGFIADSPLCRLAENFLIDLHEVSALEWSGTIFVAALLFRVSVCFPIKVYQERLMAKLLNIQPTINELIKKNQPISKDPKTLAKQNSLINKRVILSVIVLGFV
jgi:hypothetical protein